ncbi:LPXTG-motif surface-anchored protein [Staphylococcus piscifermentans]|uniref:Gram-positive cocci surface proteins LPxTG domain-containing protein n=1 Tax=Staphylococcus piscifermentans TaxID=70258 RepID=A0A239UEQ8_9STAP|nr:LPXTG cell wall anchor domain-containing protein [Staphylococcus piscifermentans]RTX84887.1 LPXTG cell wall anchor domain-containing protein [Staphylococcus piscifermentans]GEP83822.1 hypothetical protein SPI02_04070 [Staphylococcus piscifermentans]SNV08139.1 LPXTG-motif surface-anchored protein [Staphylococcus piscifermentans]
MKKLGLLGTTALASTLLFTGVQSNTANAATIDEGQASNSVKNLVENNDNYQPKSETQYTIDKDGTNPVDNSYKVAFGEEPHQAPSFLYVKKDTGDIYDYKGNLIQKASNSSANTQKQTQENNEQNNQGNLEKHNQTLPESGTESNSTLITLFGSILLTLGAFLSIKPVSKNKQK